MNSPSLSPAVSRELIRFEHPDEWQGRAGFRPSLTILEADLSHFVGGYNLAKDLYQRCGLAHGGKPCNQEHGHGFVVATKEGHETQVGKDCGLRHLGAKFEELERQFTASVRTEELFKRMSELTSKRSELLVRATQAISNCDRAAAEVAEVRQRVERERTLAEVFNHARTSDGSIYGELRVSDEEYEVTRKRYRREVFGRIDGILAAFTPSPKRSIQSTVLPFVHSLSDESLVGLSAKGLAAKSKEAGDVERLLIEADAFVALCRRFMSRRNWEAFAQAYGAGRLQTNDRGRRVLKQLVDGAA